MSSELDQMIRERWWGRILRAALTVMLCGGVASSLVSLSQM
jgi:hypothetical protein